MDRVEKINHGLFGLFRHKSRPSTNTTAEVRPSRNDVKAKSSRLRSSRLRRQPTRKLHGGAWTRDDFLGNDENEKPVNIVLDEQGVRKQLPLSKSRSSLEVLQ
mmetsp:Transcript_11671/g.35602  ORF Transcript_11671/g.35602 Transcript_11671/m.35602 type:complete len:103 (+) Transcript_11671:136-444(+)